MRAAIISCSWIFSLNNSLFLKSKGFKLRQNEERNHHSAKKNLTKLPAVANHVQENFAHEQLNWLMIEILRAPVEQREKIVQGKLASSFLSDKFFGAFYVHCAL